MALRWAHHALARPPLMTTPWTPPPGFFPDAESWFHPDNIARFQPIFRADADCAWAFASQTIYGFLPACDGSAIGKPVHIWKGTPITHEDWGIITGCAGIEYQVSGFTIPGGTNFLCTIGTGVAATLQDFWAGDYVSPVPAQGGAIRYGWYFHVRDIDW